MLDKRHWIYTNVCPQLDPILPGKYSKSNLASGVSLTLAHHYQTRVNQIPRASKARSNSSANERKNCLVHMVQIHLQRHLLNPAKDSCRYSLSLQDIRNWNISHRNALNNLTIANFIFFPLSIRYMQLHLQLHPSIMLCNMYLASLSLAGLAMMLHRLMSCALYNVNIGAIKVIMKEIYPIGLPIKQNLVDLIWCSGGV